MDTLNVGTKEIIVVKLADRLETVSDLAAYNVEQKIITEDEQTIKQDWTTVLATNLLDVECLVDTTGYTEGTYKLYVRVNIAPELPILGPFKFGVS